MNRYHLTKERHEELQNELQALKGKKRQEIAERLRLAKEYGDLSENSEYAEAREAQAVVESRIAELEEIMKNAVIIKKLGTAAQVSLGATVTARRDDAVVRYTIVGAYEAKPEEGKISDESPLGRAFLRRKVGDSVTVQAPKGKTVYHITNIE